MSRLVVSYLIVSMIVLGLAVSGPAQEGAKPIQAAALTQELAKDEKATKAKYNGKTLIVQGKVVQVETPKDKVLRIKLAGHNEKEKDVIRVICHFPPDLEAEL